MIGIVRDTWRAVLVVATVAFVREMLAEKPAPPPIVATPVWQPQPVFVPQPPPQPPRPLRRVASAVTELADSVIGVVR